MKSKHIRPNTLHASLMKLHKTHKKSARHMFKEINLTDGKPRLLDFLVNNPGCSQRELAKCCKIEPATATSILSAMENEGLIHRERNLKDKRILNVFLTQKGIDAQKEVEKVFLKLDDICFEGFSEEEKLDALKILNRLYDNLVKHKE